MGDMAYLFLPQGGAIHDVATPRTACTSPAVLFTRRPPSLEALLDEKNVPSVHRNAPSPSPLTPPPPAQTVLSVDGLIVPTPRPLSPPFRQPARAHLRRRDVPSPRQTKKPRFSLLSLWHAGLITAVTDAIAVENATTTQMTRA